MEKFMLEYGSEFVACLIFLAGVVYWFPNRSLKKVGQNESKGFFFVMLVMLVWVFLVKRYNITTFHGGFFWIFSKFELFTVGTGFLLLILGHINEMRYVFNKMIDYYQKVQKGKDSS